MNKSSRLLINYSEHRTERNKKHIANNPNKRPRHENFIQRESTQIQKKLLQQTTNTKNQSNVQQKRIKLTSNTEKEHTEPSTENRAENIRKTRPHGVWGLPLIWRLLSLIPIHTMARKPLDEVAVPAGEGRGTSRDRGTARDETVPANRRGRTEG